MSTNFYKHINECKDYAKPSLANSFGDSGQRNLESLGHLKKMEKEITPHNGDTHHYIFDKKKLFYKQVFARNAYNKVSYDK